jgi:hypothetical protein
VTHIAYGLSLIVGNGGTNDKPYAISDKRYFFGSSFNAAELMQKRWPVGAGPSGNT